MIWEKVATLGFTGGAVLEPAAGIGNFLRHAPSQSQVTAFEPNKYAAKIMEALYPAATVYNDVFESIWFNGNVHQPKTPKVGPFDLIIGNPPYGAFCGKHAGMGEKKATGVKQYDHYFMLRGLDLLKPGGLIALIIPHTTADGKYEHFKKRMFEQAHFRWWKRLPARIFRGTDIVTDIVIWQKKEAIATNALPAKKAA